MTDWNKPGPPIGARKEVTDMVKWGKEALLKLGDNPDKESKKYKDFQLSHYGQWVCHSFLRRHDFHYFAWHFRHFLKIRYEKCSGFNLISGFFFF